ncbi:MAG: cyclase family protein [Bacteroidia bacterium]
MRSFERLSYLLHENIPVYGNYVHLELERINSISKGDTANKTFLKIDSHMGTHLDFPYHFINGGKKGEEYPAEFFVCHNAKVVEIDQDSGVIKMDKVKHLTPDAKLEFLMVKTGLCYKRDERQYWEDNAGMHPDTAAFFRELFPALRFFGFDSISMNAFQHRETGRQAHLEYLGREILIVEDMDLRNVSEQTKFRNLIISPFLFEECDGAPCSIIAEVELETGKQ